MDPQQYYFLGENNKVYLLVCRKCKERNRTDKIETGTCFNCGYRESGPGPRSSEELYHGEEN